MVILIDLVSTVGLMLILIDRLSLVSTEVLMLILIDSVVRGFDGGIDGDID